MRFADFKRDVKRASSCLVEKGNSIYAVKPCKIYLPNHYRKSGLVSVEDTTTICGVYGLVTEDGYYCLSSALILFETEPFSTTIVEGDDGLEYLELTYQAGDRLMVNTEVVRVASVVYMLFDDTVSKGRTPWYIGYEDMATLFDSAQEYADMNLRADHAIFEILTAHRARISADRNKYLRHATKDGTPHVMIGLKNVVYGATNTTAKLLGSYHNDAITSALVNPSERTEKIESLLRA